jgi:hypothetical protein
MPVNWGVFGCAGRAGELSYDPGFDLLLERILDGRQISSCSDFFQQFVNRFSAQRAEFRFLHV